ncbi:MAG: phosphotransferase [Chloroflexi bacterium]|nr:phosphotransferase [Chloroflexota bacterium]
MFDRQRAAGAAKQLIHADLKPDNLLFDAGRVGFLDFDDCAWGWPLYDLAPMLLFLRTNPEYGAIKAALWESFAGSALDNTTGADLETLAAARYATSCRWVAVHHDHPSYRGKVPGILAGRASELRRYIERGAL